ncbi:hypothetical protein TRIUR3_32219 [Triticum urartu]|uniref:Uncharacterized protein n=1 Tax=Triticum urartu TaxID=4572 RepID=M7ZNP6_TRIUA|nr:hypothetical protein TRIUR3_32219 [Triticum urartu]
MSLRKHYGIVAFPELPHAQEIGRYLADQAPVVSRPPSLTNRYVPGKSVPMIPSIKQSNRPATSGTGSESSVLVPNRREQRRSVDLGSSMRGRRSSSSLNDEMSFLHLKIDYYLIWNTPVVLGCLPCRLTHFKWKMIACTKRCFKWIGGTLIAIQQTYWINSCTTAADQVSVLLAGDAIEPEVNFISRC